MHERYPRRDDLRGTVEALTDVKAQDEVWRKGDRFYTFDACVHFLFDDSHLSDEPMAELAYTLMDETEVALVSDLCARLDAMFNDLGTKLPDSGYLDSAYWPGIVESASRLKSYMAEADARWLADHPPNAGP